RTSTRACGRANKRHLGHREQETRSEQDGTDGLTRAAEHTNLLTLLIEHEKRLMEISAPFSSHPTRSTRSHPSTDHSQSHTRTCKQQERKWSASPSSACSNTIVTRCGLPRLSFPQEGQHSSVPDGFRWMKELLQHQLFLMSKI
ncbi:hypothetical protein PybrP1_004527, partial [[Pythium] brassicae (nom. inval.)]